MHGSGDAFRRDLARDLSADAVDDDEETEVGVGAVPVLVAVSHGAKGNRAALADAGVEIVELEGVEELLSVLARRGISSLMVEGGARVATGLLSRGLVDRIHLYCGQTVIGEGGIASPIIASKMPAGFALVEERILGDDRLQIYDRLPASAWL